MSPSQITTTEQFLIISTLWILLEGKKSEQWHLLTIGVALKLQSQITSTAAAAAAATTQSAFL